LFVVLDAGGHALHTLEGLVADDLVEQQVLSDDQVLAGPTQVSQTAPHFAFARHTLLALVVRWGVYLPRDSHFIWVADILLLRIHQLVVKGVCD